MGDDNNIFGLKGLTKQDWEKWQKDYQTELEGYSDQEKEDLFVDVIFNEALDKEPRYAAFEDSSRERKVKLYNYYNDVLGPRQEQEALGLVPSRQEVRKKPFGKLVDYFIKYPSEYTTEDIIEQSELHDKKQGFRETPQVFDNPLFATEKVQPLRQEQLTERVEESTKDNISERLADYEDFKYSEDDMMQVSIVQEAQKQMDATDDFNKKKEIFNRTDKDLKMLHDKRDKLLEQLQDSNNVEEVKETLVGLFDEFAKENKMYQQFKDTGKVNFTDDEKVNAVLDLYALQDSDYGSTAGTLFNNVIQKKVASYNEKNAKLDNLGKGLWGFTSKIAAVPAYIMGVAEAVEQAYNGENFIDALVDNDYTRIANNISQYGARFSWDKGTPFYDEEWVNAQKELAVSDMQLLRAPGQETDVDFTNSAFWGDMINQYGFTAASMAISGGAAMVGKTLLGSAKFLTGAMYLNRVGKTLESTRKFTSAWNTASNVLGKMGTFGNIALTAGYETTMSTLQDKLDFLEQGTEDIKNRYAEDTVKNMEYVDKVQYLNKKGYQFKTTENKELGTMQTVIEKDGKYISAENLDRHIKLELYNDATAVIAAAENGTEIPEELLGLAQYLNKDMEYLSKTADIQARAGFIAREMVYGTIAGTLKATLQAGSVQQALKNMGFGPKYGATEEGKAFLKTYLPKFMQNKYGYGAFTSAKEIGGEFIEEWEDVLASDFSQGIGNTYMSNYFKVKYDGASEDILKNQIGQAIIKGFENIDPLSEEAISSGIYGALSAGLGGITLHRGIGTTEGIFKWSPITWRSSLISGYREGVQQFEEIDQTVNAIQQWLDDPENRAKWDGAVGTVNWMEKISSDIESQDEYMYRNDNLAKMIHDIFILKKIKGSPIADQILAQIDRASKANTLSEEEKQNLITEYKNTLQNNPGAENMSDEDIISRIQKNGQKMQELYKEIDKEQDFLDSTLQDRIDQDLKESLIYGKILYKDLGERRAKMEKELSELNLIRSRQDSNLTEDQRNGFAVYGQHGMNKTLVGYDKKIKELEKQLAELKSSKRSSKSDWSDIEELLLRQTKANLKKYKKLRGKAESQKRLLQGVIEDGTVLSEKEIMSLQEDVRAFMLDSKNASNYSKEQQEVIDSVKQQLYKRSLERQDGRLYIDMIQDLAKTLVDSQAFEDYQFALQMDTRSAGVYAVRFANKVKKDRIKGMAKNFKNSHQGKSYSEWRVAYGNTTKNMSRQEQDMFDVELRNVQKDPNMTKYLAEQGRKRDLLNFANSKNLKLREGNRDLPINSKVFEETISLLQENNLDPTDLNQINQIKEFLTARGYSQGTLNEDYKLIVDNYEQILKQFNDYKAEREKQRKMPEPKTQEKSRDSHRDALEELVDSLSKEEVVNSGDTIKDTENLDAENIEYDSASDADILEFYKDSPILNVISALLEAVNSSPSIAMADIDGNIKKAFKYTIQSMKGKTELQNKRAFLDQLTKELAKRNLGEKTKQFRLLLDVVITTVRNATNKDIAKEYNSNKTHNINAQAISPMDVFSNEIYLPYQLFFQQYGVEEFLEEIYSDGSFANESFQNNIFFICDAIVESADGTKQSLISMLRESFAKADSEFNDTDSIPIIAVVKSNKGTLVINDENGKPVTVQPIAVYPTTGSSSNGSTGLADFRKLANDQLAKQPDYKGFILDESGKPLQPLKEAPLASKKAPIEAKNRFEEGGMHDVSAIMQNDASKDEKEILQGDNQEEKKTILEQLRDRFFASLKKGKSSKSGDPVLIYTGESNMKGEQATADIFVKTPEETTNSEGKHLNEVEDVGAFNTRTIGYGTFLAETLQEILDTIQKSEFGALNISSDNKAILTTEQQKVINDYQESLNSVLGKYIDIPSTYKYILNISNKGGAYTVEFNLYDTINETSENIATFNSENIAPQINMKPLFFNSEGNYRQYLGEPFAKWQVDYDDIIGESKWSKDNPKALWAMRNGIFSDNILYSRRPSFKYRPIGVRINNPFKKAKKEALPPKPPTGDPDSGVGMPAKDNPDLVKERKEKLEGLQNDAKNFRQGAGVSESEASVTDIASTEARWLQADINYYDNKPDINSTENYLGQTADGSIIYRKGDSIFIANRDGQYAELSLPGVISELDGTIILSEIERYENDQHISLFEFKGNANNILAPLQVIGKNLMHISTKTTGTGGKSELNIQAAFKYGNQVDSMARGVAQGRYDKLVEDFLAIPENSITARVEYCVEHRQELEQFTNMTPIQAMNALADMHQKFKEAFKGHVVLAEELFCRGKLEVRDSIGNKRTMGYRGFTDIVTIGPDGRLYIYDVKTYKQEQLSPEKLQQYTIQLSLYAKAIAEQLGIPATDIVLGVIPVKLDYDNNKITDAVKDQNTGDTILYQGNQLFELSAAPKIADSGFIMVKAYNGFHLLSSTMSSKLRGFISQDDGDIQMETIEVSEEIGEEDTDSDQFKFTENNFKEVRNDSSSSEGVTYSKDVNSQWGELNPETQKYLESVGMNQEVWDASDDDLRQQYLSC